MAGSKDEPVSLVGLASSVLMTGALMTAADAGQTNLDIIGPPDVGHQLATMRASIYR